MRQSKPLIHIVPFAFPSRPRSSAEYLRGLADAVIRHGGQIFTGTNVEGWWGETAGSLRQQLPVTAKAVVVATNTPINDRFVIHTKQAPYTTYVIGLQTRRGDVTRALFWDTAERAGTEDILGGAPYHYVRLARADDGDDEVLIVGGEDHKTGQADDFEQRFQRWKTGRASAGRRRRCPLPVVGQVMEPVDGLGYIGRNPGREERLHRYRRFREWNDSRADCGMLISELSGVAITLGPNSTILRANRAHGPRFREGEHQCRHSVRRYFTGGDADPRMI